MVDLEKVVKPHDIDLLQALVENHRRLTGSAPAQYKVDAPPQPSPFFLFAILFSLSLSECIHLKATEARLL